jgi:hypothetical protein
VATQIFSEAELERLRGFPEVDREQLVRFFTLTPTDEAFVRSHRAAGPRLAGPQREHRLLRHLLLRGRLRARPARRRLPPAPPRPAMSRSAPRPPAVAGEPLPPDDGIDPAKSPPRPGREILPQPVRRPPRRRQPRPQAQALVIAPILPLPHHRSPHVGHRHPGPGGTGRGGPPPRSCAGRDEATSACPNGEVPVVHARPTAPPVDLRLHRPVVQVHPWQPRRSQHRGEVGHHVPKDAAPV